MQCFLSSLVHVKSGEQFCDYWSKTSGQPSQVSYYLLNLGENNLQLKVVAHHCCVMGHCLTGPKAVVIYDGLFTYLLVPKLSKKIKNSVRQECASINLSLFPF